MLHLTGKPTGVITQGHRRNPDRRSGPIMRLLVMVALALTDRHRNAIYGAEALLLSRPAANSGHPDSQGGRVFDDVLGWQRSWRAMRERPCRLGPCSCLGRFRPVAAWWPGG